MSARGSWLAAVAAVLAGAAARAQTCPPDCLAFGRPAANACLIEFGGIASAVQTCTDGDACDADGAVNGACTVKLTACLGLPAAGCVAAIPTRPPGAKPLGNPDAQALAAALAALDPTTPGCTTRTLTLALPARLGGIGSAASRITLDATAGRRRAHYKLRFACRPAPTPPSFAGAVQPILSTRCAVPACHGGAQPVDPPTFDADASYAAIVGAPSRNVPALKIVAPGSIRDSYLARKILGKRIVDRTQQMPQGCPGAPPPTGCLTPPEVASIVAWIAGGAPAN